MKRLWVAVALLLLITIIALTEFYIVNKNYNFYASELENAEVYFSNKEYNVAYDYIKDIQQNWENDKDALDIFIAHEKIDLISESLSQLDIYVLYKEKSHFFSECEKTKRQLLCLKQSELPKFKNII